MKLKGRVQRLSIVIATAVVLVVFATYPSSVSAQCIDNFFSVKPAITAGNNSRSVVFGDFNRDGFNDIAVASTANNTLRVRLGNGTGGYGPEIIRNVGSAPVVVVTADFNRDGKLDLAATNQGNATISVALGNGDGSFAEPSTLETGGSPEGLVAADFNSDGKMDLAVAYLGGVVGGVHVFYGNASGFDAPMSVSVGVAPRFVYAADMDRSGTPDLVITYDNPDAGEGKVSIRYKNFGGNLFSGVVDITVGDYPVAMSVGDVNNDTYPDVATANFNGNSVSVVMSQDAPNGLYTVQTINTDDSPHSVVIADVNQDGQGDVSVVSQGEGVPTAEMLLGDGAGSFTSTSRIPIGVSPYSVAVTDYNLDAKPDIVSVGGSSITVLENTCPLYSGAITGLDAGLPTSSVGDLDYCAPDLMPFTGSGLQYETALADYKLCGESATGFVIDAGTPLESTIVEPEPIAITTTTTGVTASTTQTPIYAATTSGRAPVSLTGASNNAIDGKLRLKFYKKNGLTFEEKASKIIDEEIGSAKTGALTQADVDGDGIVEFIIADADAGLVYVEKIMGPEGAAPYFKNEKIVSVGQMPIKIQPGDFNKDGKDDFVTINEGSKTLSLYISADVGSLLELSSSYSLGGATRTPTDLSVTDINMDGNLDVLIGTTDGLVSMLGDGSGLLGVAKTIETDGSNILSVNAADMNLDGKTDVVATAKNTVTNETKLEVTVSTIVPGGSTEFTGVTGSSILASEGSKLLIKKLNPDAQPDVLLNSKLTGERQPVLGTLYASPFPKNDQYSVAPGETLNEAAPGVISNDAFPASATVEAELVSGPTNSAGFQLNADGSFTYTASSYNGGEDSFTYRLKHGAIESPNATVTILISDSTPPVITPTVFGTLGNDGWYTSNIDISWSVVDAESGISSQSGCGDVTVSNDTSGETYTCSATSAGGSDSQSVTVKRDATPPTLTPSVSPNPVVLGGSAAASANALDTMSGIASQSCDSPNTSSVGFKSLTCSATDNAGNSNSANASYQVIFNFQGFFQPVDMMPVINNVKAGQSVPIRFSLSGYQGMGIISPGYPAFTDVACSASEPSSTIEETSGPGLSDLTYDASTDQYQYTWKTKKWDRGTCQILVVQLIDGTVHLAKFRLK